MRTTQQRWRIKAGLTVICFMFGVALVSQIRTESRIRSTVTADSATELAAIAGDLYDNNSALRTEVEKLVSERTTGALRAGIPPQTDKIAELQRLRGFNGVVPVSGPGVQLIVDVALRPTDLLDLMNEFRNAGAEAIAIGEQRIVYNTPIAGSQGDLTVNGERLEAPYLVRAVGDPDILDRALARKGGMLAYLRTSYPKAVFVLETSDAMTLPAYAPGFGIRPGA